MRTRVDDAIHVNIEVVESVAMRLVLRQWFVQICGPSVFNLSFRMRFSVSSRGGAGAAEGMKGRGKRAGPYPYQILDHLRVPLRNVSKEGWDSHHAAATGATWWA